MAKICIKIIELGSIGMNWMIVRERPAEILNRLYDRRRTGGS